MDQPRNPELITGEDLHLQRMMYSLASDMILSDDAAQPFLKCSHAPALLVITGYAHKSMDMQWDSLIRAACMSAYAMSASFI